MREEDRERERERDRDIEIESMWWVREREIKCVSVRNREGEIECYVHVIESVYISVCKREREIQCISVRDRERERVLCACDRECVYKCM